jgi:hypothetical protein
VIAAMSFAYVAPALTTLSLTGPLSSCTSSRATTSGAARFTTMARAMALNLSAGSAGSRFSTLNVAIASRAGDAGSATSGMSPPLMTMSGAVTWTLKLPPA